MVESHLILKSIVIMVITMLIMSLFLKRFNQPYFVAYFMAVILLGPWGIKVFDNPDTVAVIGELGLIIQMFFIGAEIEVPL